jgi:cyclophilin family peptidyl-prolyl cis-trans isomerase/tetratricopeptide (TPR) repeat protein
MRTRVSILCDKVIEAGWLAAVIVVPLFFNIFSNRVFEPDKLSLLRSIALVMSAAWLIRTVEDRRVLQAEGIAQTSDKSFWQRVYHTPLVLPTLLLVLVYLISTALSVTWKVSLLGSYQRMQGTYTTISYIVIFFLALQELRSKRQLNRLLTVMILTSFPVALYGLIQHFGMDPLPWGGDVQTRVASNMGNAIFVAAYLIMVVPLTLTRVLENWKEAVGRFETRDVVLGLVAFVLLAATLLAAMLLRSDGGALWVRWLGLVIGAVLQVPVYLLTPPQSRSRVLTISLPLTFAFLVAFSWILEILFPPSSANYFWLGLLASLIFVFAMAAFAYYLRKPVSRLLLLAGYFVILIAQVVCIFYTQSRGPLLGLLGGVFFYLALLGLVRRRVWVPWVMSNVTVFVIGFLLVFNTVEAPWIESLRETPYVGRLGKLLQTEEGTGKVRVLIWEGAAEMIGWHEPLEYPGEEERSDAVNALRPVIGYGPESMYVAYNRFYPPELAHFEKRNASPDRSHNETFDALVITGGLGLAAYLFLFISIFYYGFKWLGLVYKPWHKPGLVGLCIGGMIVGAFGSWVWRGPAYLGVGIPLGALLGIALYALIALLQATFRPQSQQHLLPRYSLWMLALLSAVVAHYIEIQFGIAIAATRTYFWVLAAVQVVIGTRLSAQPEAVGPAVLETGAPAKEEPPPEPRRRRRRGAAPASQARPGLAASRNWYASLLVLSAVAILILGTLLFDSLTVQQGNPGLLTTIWNSLTQSKNQPSLVMLVFLLFTWGTIGLIGLGDLATQAESEGKEPVTWLAAGGIFALISLGGALLFALLHAIRLRPVTISSADAPNPLANTITFYYVFLFVTILALALALVLLRKRRSIAAWRWTGALGDLGVIALAVVLPIVVGLLIFVTNITIIRADILYKQGLSSEKAQQWDGAIFFYEKAVELAPSQDFYYLFLGRAYLEKAKASPAQEREYWLSKSETALKTARQVEPLNTDHSRNLSKLYLTWGNLSEGEQRTESFNEAVAYSADATSLSPNTADVWNERAQIYIALGDYEEAIQTYQESLALDDEYIQTHLALAELYKLQAEWDKAEQAYVQAIEANPRSVQPHLHLGQLYIRQKDWEKAVTAFQQALELKANSAEAYGGLGYVYTQLGDVEAALQAYLKATELAPGDYNNHKNLAILYQQLGQTDNAIMEATEALAVAPEDQKPSLEAFLAQLGQPVSASSPESAEEVQSLLTQGRGQMEAEDWAAAETSYQQVIELEPSNALAHSALAYVYARQGRLEEAISENLQVLELLPNDYNSLKNLAILYQQVGDIPKAIEAAELALPLAPETEQEALQAFLEQLRQLPGTSSSAPETGERAGDLTPKERDTMYSAPPPTIIEPGKSYQATIVTEKGNIVLELHADLVPNTVNNFVFLAREGFYDNTTFHRVLPGFMAQGGDPTGTGSGGPGYTFADEFHPELRHDGQGVLSMANSGPSTNGSQFFITYDATPWLDDRHTVFGRVTQGMEVLEALTERDPQANPDYPGDAILTIVIQEE